MSEVALFGTVEEIALFGAAGEVALFGLLSAGSDTTAPVLTVTPAANVSQSVPRTSSATFPTVTAVDDVDGAITITAGMITDLDNRNAGGIGSQTRSYAVPDAAGNVANLTLSINYLPITHTVAASGADFIDPAAALASGSTVIGDRLSIAAGTYDGFYYSSATVSTIVDDGAGNEVLRAGGGAGFSLLQGNLQG